jgi:hypothetical protein
MLELIFQGFVEWGYGLVLECWEYFSGVLLDILSMDFTYLRTHVPVVDTIMQIMLAVGWALLLGNLVFQSLKSMVSGLGFEGEDPKLLFTRTFVFAFLLLASPQICRMGLNMTQTVIDILQIPDAVVITFADESIFRRNWSRMDLSHNHRHHCYVQGFRPDIGDSRTVCDSRDADHLRAAGFRRRRKPEHIRYFYRLVPDVRFYVLYDGQQRHFL